MKIKSKWFYTEFKNDTQAVVLLAHGLNLHPQKMDQLASFFNKNKCDVLRIALGNNPNEWCDKFSDDVEAVVEHAHILERPLYFVGFSLGALVGIHYMAKHAHQEFTKAALFAPATHTKMYTRIPSLLFNFFPKGSLPSLNLVDYREREKTKLSEYRKMHELQKEIKYYQINIPTLLILNPKDELVASSQVALFAAHNKHSKVFNISNEDSPLSKKYHHLMIDENSLGHSAWKKILHNLTEHFSL